jgi:hypothetical protein
MGIELETICLDRQQIDAIKMHLGLSVFKEAEFSFLFIAELFNAHTNQIYNTYAILDEIKNIEGLSSRTMTKPASPFDRPPLKGLWHKHHFQASFLLQNIGNHWKINRKKQLKLSAMISECIKEEELGNFSDELAAKLSYKFVHEAYASRASENNITGEWIIFAKHNNKNYYLTLSSHTKGKVEDEKLYRKILKNCSEQYPFLFDQAQ